MDFTHCTLPLSDEQLSSNIVGFEMDKFGYDAPIITAKCAIRAIIENKIRHTLNDDIYLI